MPPNTRKAPRRGAEGGASSDAAVEDEVDVGAREDWNNAARDAARGKKAAMRNDHLAMILALREGGKEMLKGGGPPVQNRGLRPRPGLHVPSHTHTITIHSLIQNFYMSVLSLLGGSWGWWWVHE